MRNLRFILIPFLIVNSTPKGLPLSNAPVLYKPTSTKKSNYMQPGVNCYAHDMQKMSSKLAEVLKNIYTLEIDLIEQCF